MFRAENMESMFVYGTLITMGWKYKTKYHYLKLFDYLLLIYHFIFKNIIFFGL